MAIVFVALYAIGSYLEYSVATDKGQEAAAIQADIEKAAAAFQAMSADEHLRKSEATLAVLTGNDAHLDQAEKHIQAAIAKEGNTAKSSQLLVTLKQRRAELIKARSEAYRAQKEAEEIVNLALRKDTAKRMENILLDNGMNADVYTSGKEHRILTIKYALASKVLVRQVTKEWDFDNFRKLGFRQVVLTDGYESRWSWTLDK